MQIKAHILPARGIGDALLMQIVAYRLAQEGYEVITYHSALQELKGWFEHGLFFPSFSLDHLPFSKEDMIIVENDNSNRCKRLVELRHEGLLPHVHMLYPTYLLSKHGPLTSQDCVFDPSLSMAENIAIASCKLWNFVGVSRNNGLTAPSHLIYRKAKSRVIIHPTSSQQEKNWTKTKFQTLAQKLLDKGFTPVFVVSEEERKEWEGYLKEEFLLPRLPKLSDLAELVFESGFVIGNDSLVGHLGSNLQIPTLIIANDKKRMQLWRPGWLKGEVVTPSPYIPNFSPLRLRSRLWKKWILVSHVLHRFEQLSRTF